MTTNNSVNNNYPNLQLITQASHGFTAGQSLALSGTTYVTAKADSVSNAEVVGIISSIVNTNVFQLTTNGKVTGLSGLTAGTVYFLDPTTAGALTATIPSTNGQVIKPLLVADSTTSGYFTNMRGQQIAATKSITLAGIGTLVGGTLTINTSAATATCAIAITLIGGGLSPGFLKYTVSAGTSFTVTSSVSLDTSNFSYIIVEP